MPSLLWNAKHFLLTYAHVNGEPSDSGIGRPALDPAAIVAHVGRLGGRCIVGKEKYNDSGAFHFHVFIGFERKFRSRRVDVFDVDGYHPNVVPSRGNPELGWDYATKDDDIVGGDLERPGGTGNPSATERWSRIVQAESLEEFWSLLEMLDPQRMACNFPALQRFADWKFKVEPKPYRTPPGRFETDLYPELGEWAHSLAECSAGMSAPRRGPLCLHGPAPFGAGSLRSELFARVRANLSGRKRSLVLWGPTRTGKTTWARSLGPHLYFCGLYSYKEAKGAATATYAIFDDIQGGIKFFPAFKNWLGCQYQFQIKGLYRDPELLTWGKPSIWVANSDPREDMTPTDTDWLEGNCVFVNVTTAIFRANTPQHPC